MNIYTHEKYPLYGIHSHAVRIIFLIVARIRFQSSHYTVSEGSPSICVPVENMAPPAMEDFAVSYSFGKIYVDHQCTKSYNL